MSPKSPENLHIPDVNSDNIFESADKKRKIGKKQRVFGAAAGIALLAGGLSACGDGEVEATPSPTETTISVEPTVEPTPDVDPDNPEVTDPSREDHSIYEGGWNGEYEVTEDLLRIPQGLSAQDFIEAAIDRKYRIIDAIVSDPRYGEDVLSSDLSGDGFAEFKGEQLADLIAASNFAPGWQDNPDLVREYERIKVNLPQYRENWYNAWFMDGSDYYYLPESEATLIDETEYGRVIDVTVTTRTNLGDIWDKSDSDGEIGKIIVNTEYIDGYEYISGQSIVN